MSLHGARWLEASYRNRESHVKVSAFSSCHTTYPCEDVCIELRPNGWRHCRPAPKYDACGCEIAQTCPDKYVTVCSSYLDENGLHVFAWTDEVLNLHQGFYLGVIKANGCDIIGQLPVRVGPHPTASYAEGPINTNVIDCVTCDDGEGKGFCDSNPNDCGCETDTSGAYIPTGV